VSYTKEKIINDEDVKVLINLYNKTPSKIAYQDFNLHNVDKRLVHKSLWDTIEPIKKLRKYSGGLEHRTHYFLRYMPGSFTSLHCDDKRNVGLTIVTFLQLKDLIGGDTLFIKKFEGVERTEEMYDTFDKTKNTEGRYIVPDIARDVEVGDSVIYSQDIRHGMTEIKQGQRIVLVSWFKPIDKSASV